jgi:hypothetical protein
MKRLTAALAVLSAVAMLGGEVRAKHHPHYGAVGVQMGFYRVPAAPMGYAAPGYGCSGAGYGYAVPSAGYATPSAGYAAPSYGYGCSGSSAGYGYSAPGYGYSAPGYGYGYGTPGGNPSAGLLFPGGGVMDILQLIQAIGCRGAGGSAGDDGAARKDLRALEDKVDRMQRNLDTLKVPDDLAGRFTKLDKDLEAIRRDLGRIDSKLDKEIDRINGELKKKADK